jgi:hypothetical protein
MGVTPVKTSANLVGHHEVDNNNHPSLLSLWNLEIMKDTLRLLSFHLRMLPSAVGISVPRFTKSKWIYIGRDNHLIF